MTIHKTTPFKNGGSQAVRIPAELRFEDGAEIFIYPGERDGEVVLTTHKRLEPFWEFIKTSSEETKTSPSMTADEAAQWLADIRALSGRGTERDRVRNN